MSDRLWTSDKEQDNRLIPSSKAGLAGCVRLRATKRRFFGSAISGIRVPKALLICALRSSDANHLVFPDVRPVRILGVLHFAETVQPRTLLYSDTTRHR